MNKIYLRDVGHRNSLLQKLGKEVLQDSDRGFLIQTAVFDHASRLRFYLTEHTEHEIFYWEDATGEVDIIIPCKNVVIPIEVKATITKPNASLRRFLAENKAAPWGVIITKDTLKIEGNILYCPLWAFFLMC